MIFVEDNQVGPHIFPVGDPSVHPIRGAYFSIS